MRKTKEDRFYRQLLDILNHAKGEKIEIAAMIYHAILQEEDKASAFQCFLENINETEEFGDEEKIEESGMKVSFTKERIERLTRDCMRLIEGILDKIIGQNLEPADFYHELWEKGIENNKFLSKEEEKIYALYRIWIDGRIPYFKLEEGICMDRDRFSEIMKEKEEEIKKMIYIFNYNFAQKTERSSQFIKIIDSCKTEEEKAVIMAQILSLTEQFGRFKERIEMGQKGYDEMSKGMMG